MDRRSGPNASDRARRRLVLAVVPLAAVVWFSWQSADGTPPALPAGERTRDENAAAPATASGLPAVVADAGSERIAREPPPPVDVSLPWDFVLELRVVDPFDLPVPDAHVFVAPSGCGLGLLPGATDARGRLAFQCRGRQAKLQLWLLLLANGIVEPLRMIELEAGAPARVTIIARGRLQDTSELEQLLAGGADSQRLKVLLARRRADSERDDRRNRRGRLQRRDELDMLCGRSVFLFQDIDCMACHAPSKVAAYQPLQRAADLRPGLHPAAIFRDLALAPPSVLQRTQRKKQLQAQAVDAVAQRLQREASSAPTGMIAGRVSSADGLPAVSVPVAWLDPDGSLRLRTETDANSNYRLRLPIDLPIALVAGGGGAGRAEAIVTAVPQSTVKQDFALRADAVVRGTTRDDRDLPLAGWRVEFECITQPGAALATTRSDGSFVLAHLADAGRCFLWPADGDLALPVLTSAIVLPDGPAVALRLSATTPSRARLRLRPLLPPGHPHVPVELRILQVDSGRGAHLVPTGFDESFELEGLAAGFYRGEVGAPGLGWVPFGPVHLDGRGLWDLGTIALPLPGRVRFLPEDGAHSPLAGEHAFYRRTEATDIATEEHATAADTVELPAGDYALLWRGDDGERSVAFRVAPGEETLVPIVRV